MKVSLLIFLLLQALDVATTVIVLRMGGSEQNPFIARFLALGPIQGLIVSKIVVVAVATGAALLLQRPNAIRWANVVFSLIVAWNITVIARLAVLASGLPR